MPISYRINKERGWVELRVEEDWSFEEHVRAFKALLADPEFEPSMDSIFEVGKSINPPTGDDVRNILALIRANQQERGRNYRAAFVAENDLPFGISRMAELMNDSADYEIKVFRERADAEAWLSKKKIRKDI